MFPLFLFVFHPIFVILAGNEDMRCLKSDQIRPPTAELAALERVKKAPKPYSRKNFVSIFS